MAWELCAGVGWLPTDYTVYLVTVPVFSVYVYISSNQAAGHGQSRAWHRGHGDSDAARCYDDTSTSTLVNTSVEIINQLLRLLLPALQGTQSARKIRTIFVIWVDLYFVFMEKCKSVKSAKYCWVPGSWLLWLSLSPNMWWPCCRQAASAAHCPPMAASLHISSSVPAINIIPATAPSTARHHTVKWPLVKPHHVSSQAY